jgi:NhaP-type Na+/H+ or K+/H+ antiporter
MVVVVSAVITRVYKHQRRVSRTAISIAQPKTQFVLVLAGLRGAVSLALVENVPIYNNVTEEGCEFKQLMKGMTSGCILFTTFVFGCAAFFILPRLGITPDPKNAGDSLGSPRDSLASPRTIPEGDEGEEEKPSIEII